MNQSSSSQRLNSQQKWTEHYSEKLIFFKFWVDYRKSRTMTDRPTDSLNQSSTPELSRTQAIHWLVFWRWIEKEGQGHTQNTTCKSSRTLSERLSPSHEGRRTDRWIIDAMNSFSDTPESSFVDLYSHFRHKRKKESGLRCRNIYIILEQGG